MVSWPELFHIQSHIFSHRPKWIELSWLICRISLAKKVYYEIIAQPKKEEKLKPSFLVSSAKRLVVHTGIDVRFTCSNFSMHISLRMLYRRPFHNPYICNRACLSDSYGSLVYTFITSSSFL